MSTVPVLLPTVPVLLRKFKDVYRRYIELEHELADLDRQIVESDSSSKSSRRKALRASPQISADDVIRSMLRVMREAKDPLPPREVASRLGITAIVARRQLLRAVKLGYVERASNARYRVSDAVPAL